MIGSDNPQGIEDLSYGISESDAEALGSMFQSDDFPADTATEKPDDENVEDENEDTAEIDEDQPDDDSDEDTEDEDTGEEADLAFVDENAVVKLDDGTTTTVKELRQGNLRDADYRRKTMELADERRNYEAQVNQVKQLEQQAAQEREWMASALKANMPQKPDPSMMETDPIGYMQQKEAYEQFSGQFQQLENQRQQAMQAQTKEQQAAQQQYLDREREAMLSANPELREPEKLAQFWNDASTTFAKTYGFQADELNALSDHRLVKVMKSAMAYDKLMAEKPKARKSLEGKPPVLKSDPRQGRKTRASKSVTDRISRAAQTGNTDSVADLLGQLITGE